MAATAVDEVTSARPHASALTEPALRSDFTTPPCANTNPKRDLETIRPPSSRGEMPTLPSFRKESTTSTVPAPIVVRRVGDVNVEAATKVASNVSLTR